MFLQSSEDTMALLNLMGGAQMKQAVGGGGDVTDPLKVELKLYNPTFLLHFVFCSLTFFLKLFILKCACKPT